jgi:hypothetical protein
METKLVSNNAEIVVAPTAEAAAQLPMVAGCSICCCEDKAPSEMVSLTSSGCQHESCKECMVKWIEKDEVSDTARQKATPAPTCPFCRVVLAKQDILAILGRPFQPGTTTAAATSSSSNLNQRVLEEVDDYLTLQWLQELWSCELSSPH